MTLTDGESLWIDTGAPGSIVEVVEVDGITLGLNGNGTIVEYALPPLDEPQESPADKVERLKGELKEAKAELKKAGGS